MEVRSIYAGAAERRMIMALDSGYFEVNNLAKTNADKIRSMSDEGLKEFICSNSQCKFCKFERWGRCDLLEWLQQPVKENDYD